MDWYYMVAGILAIIGILSYAYVFFEENKLSFIWHYWEMEGSLLTTLWGSLTINNTTISLFGNFKTRNKPQITYYSILLIRRNKDV